MNDRMNDRGPVRWQRKSQPTATPAFTMPGWGTAIRRGLLMRCPSCGKASAFANWFNIRPRCPSCDAPLGDVPCESLPPYLTIVIGLAIIGIALILSDRHGHLDYRTSLLIFIPFAIFLQLVVQRPIKGVVLAVMMKLNMVRETHDG